jgi:tRNA1Val (adenine37-N6)-methyltransferase
MAFRFKQFSVQDDSSTLRVGTDAVLLGSWVQPGPAESILEIGTGCGVIALMMAQRTHGRIDAIDIDAVSIEQARENFLASPWPDNLNAVCSSLQDFAEASGRKYDLIVTNPPFFTGSLKPPDARKTTARHTTRLSPEELLKGVRHFLSDAGVFFVILPVTEGFKFIAAAEPEGLFLQRQMNVSPKAGKPVNRLICMFSRRHSGMPVSEELIIRNAEGTFTKEYIAFTREYYFSLG